MRRAFREKPLKERKAFLKEVDGPHDAPYAQKLDVGWVIVGNICLGGVHKPATVN